MKQERLATGQERNMAHFAEIKTENNEVIRVVVINDSDIAPYGEDSPEAEQWVANNIPKDGYLNENVFDGNYPETYWKRTSYNTRNNQHINGGTPFRGNGAGAGSIYDSENDVFWAMKPHASWVKNLSTVEWEAPVAFPTYNQELSGTTYEIIPRWDEDNLKWVGRTVEDTPRTVEWDPNNSTWNLI
jgi:hypothetical protein